MGGVVVGRRVEGMGGVLWIGGGRIRNKHGPLQQCRVQYITNRMKGVLGGEGEGMPWLPIMSRAHPE